MNAKTSDIYLLVIRIFELHKNGKFLGYYLLKNRVLMELVM